MSCTILKFGGTSLEAGFEGVERALVAEQQAGVARVVVVVSAIGDTTDQLVRADLDGVIAPELAARFGPGELLDVLHGLLAGPPGPPRRDAILALGELHSARCVAAWLRARGHDARPVDARPLVRTDGAHGEARVRWTETAAALREAARSWPAAPVVTGFIGSGPDGATTTLGRGGSDYTATLVGAALSAPRVGILTDVHGVMTADPRVVPEAQTLATLSFADAVALARAGARVLHPRTLDPLRHTATRVFVRHGARRGPQTLLGEDLQTRMTSLACTGGRVTAVGPRRHALLEALAGEGVVPHDAGVTDDAAYAVVDDPVGAVRSAHRALFGSGAAAQVFLLGAGGVGRALLEQLTHATLPAIQPVLVGVATRSIFAFRPGGLEPDRWREAAVEGPWDHGQLLDQLARLERPVLVDCTADPDLAPLYAQALRRGVAVVAANKGPLSAEQAARDMLIGIARRTGVGFRYETTVGAAVPVLHTLRDLLDTGDEVLRIEGSLSGTLAYICDRVSRGEGLADALHDAVRRGFTEPRPQDDLSGLDVARKALILARELGMQLELDDVTVEPLVDRQQLAEPDVPTFLGRLDGSTLEARAASAREQGQVVRYLARIDPERRRLDVGPVAVGPDHPAFAMPPGQAQVAFTTRRYRQAPLVLQGAGAGCEVTAAGLMSDLIRVSRRALV